MRAVDVCEELKHRDDLVRPGSCVTLRQLLFLSIRPRTSSISYDWRTKAGHAA